MKRGMILVFVFVFLFLALPFSLAASVSDNLPVQIRASHDKLKNVQFLGQASIK